MFKRHVRRHEAGKKQECPECGKLFAYVSDVQVHMRHVHMKDKPFKCTLCDKQYFVSSKLNYHMLSHSEERTLRCPTCDKGFYMPSDLKLLMITHTKEKYCLCHICGKLMAKLSLVRHLRNQNCAAKKTE